MKNNFLALIIGVSIAPFAACTATEEPAEPAAPAAAAAVAPVAPVAPAPVAETDLDRPSFSASQSMVVSAAVAAIDHESRAVTLRTADGEEISFTASEEARNLDQVSVGDLLVVEYVETVSIDVIANDGMEPVAVEAAEAVRTEAGEMPGFAAMDTTVITATVEEINIEMNTFKLKGPEGVVKEFVAQNPDNLKRTKVGDLVVMSMSTAIGIIVEKQEAE
jgi:hypothetical protein